MNKPCLHDREVYPTDEVLRLYLGNIMKSWDSLLELLKTEHPLISYEWRYYNDGKNWLVKATKKTKTICWISVWQKYFKVTFYFSRKAEDFIKTSILDETIKKSFLEQTVKGKIRPITIEVRKKSDLNNVKTLIGVKERTL